MHGYTKKGICQRSQYKEKQSRELMRKITISLLKLLDIAVPEAGSSYIVSLCEPGNYAMLKYFELHFYYLSPKVLTLGAGDGQGSLVCCSPQGHKELD